MFQKFSFIFLFFCFNAVFSQKENDVTNKGKFFVYWGWNFDSYSKSDIHFTGKNYDFTLFDVKARDKVAKPFFSYQNYFRLDRITIPQTNFRIGYFFKENYTVSLGVDHMKYVMIPNQEVTISGKININSTFDGTYNQQKQKLTEDFLQFEHTDGLNYVNVELKRFDDVSRYLGIQSKYFQINITEGIGVGVLYPKTNATLLGKKRYDDFHLSGFGTSLVAGINLSFLKHFFFQSDIKGGYIYMPDIRTTQNKEDKASQGFFFLEKSILIGGKFRL